MVFYNNKIKKVWHIIALRSTSVSNEFVSEAVNWALYNASLSLNKYFLQKYDVKQELIFI